MKPWWRVGRRGGTLLRSWGCGGLLVLGRRGGFRFLGIMRRMICLLRSGGILQGTFGVLAGGGLGLNLRFFGWGWRLGRRAWRRGRVLGVGMRCIRRTLRFPTWMGGALCIMSGLLVRHLGRGSLRRRGWMCAMMGGRFRDLRRFGYMLRLMGMGSIFRWSGRRRRRFMGMMGFRVRVLARRALRIITPLRAWRRVGR